MSQPVSTMVQAPLPTSTTIVTTITTTTSLPPPPPQPQQSTTDLILIHRIGEIEQHMADSIQSNLALEERLDKHGSRLYKLENLNILHRVQKAVDQVVTDALDWAMQAPLRARFSDLSTIDMKEILHQRMFEDNSYEAYEVHTWMKLAGRKERDVPHQELLLALHHHSTATTSTSSNRHIWCSSKAPSSSIAMASTLESKAWTTSDTRYESMGVSADQDSSPTKSLMHDDSTPDEQTILPSNVSDVENNWASALASSYEPPAENSLLAKTGDMTTFLNWYCRQINKSKLTQADLEGHAYEVVKVFYPNIIHLQFQMEECHKMLTDQVDWANPEGDQVRINVNRPLPLSGPPGHVIIQTKFFFNKDLEYLRFGNKGSMHVLSISKIKATRYPDFGLELLVPEQM
ncbi:hypothetical protein Tco_1048592 [Tanacetum coccineum]